MLSLAFITTKKNDRMAAWFRFNKEERVIKLKNRRINDDVLELVGDDGNVMLSIAENIQSGVMEMTLAGELRGETAHEFEDEVMAALSVCDTIRISFERVTYVAGAALGCLLAVQRIAEERDGARIVIVRPSRPVMEKFGELGFDEILDIEDEKYAG